MTVRRTIVATTLLIATGSLMMYWPLAVMACILAIALIGAVLNRGPIGLQSRDRGPDIVAPPTPEQSETADLTKAA